ncbi:hypothetical protein [Bosea sp. 685]|uniref:hypothetical protein n=1 Tax=Bosea sp. 685 TaxID=3080057 RepID=UPI00289298F3|nr:hypothetical protein [Bosea sp. 685]WNJ92840.1 hypothetical protein RMR04_11295 [Bosea sp. 685]
MTRARRFALLLVAGILLSASVDSWMAWAAGPAEGGGGPGQDIAAERELPRLDVPAGFCPVEPQRGGNHAKLWESFTPPPQRNSKLLALEIDCATLREIETGPLRRPRSLFSVLTSPPDPRLPNSLEGALGALETRFSRAEIASKAPVLGRDGYAVYVEQRQMGRDGRPGLAGVSAFTLWQGKPFILNVIQFDGEAQVPEIRTRLAATVRSLHDLSR